jgi:four helix bundle protein
MVNSYKDLIVWQKSVDLCEEVYRQTEKFPKSEAYGLTSQIRRCVVSIPSNIAEGQRRGHKLEYIHFLRIAFGSGAELETQLIISQKVGFIDEKNLTRIDTLLSEIMKMLNVMISRLSTTT